MSRFVLTNPHMLSILIYQALVPRLCPHCKLSVAAYPKSSEDYEEVEYIASQMHRLFGLDSSWFALRNLKGCEQCRRRGTVGLTVVAEVLTPDRAWLDLIRDRQDQAAIDHFRRVSDGDLHSACMDGKTVFEHTLFKATTGEVDPRQCLRFESLEHYAIQRV
jgi:type II secretory ATPase GspE/PulE/Tfp pilus assembly ATPase PilB-like protein